MKLNSNTIVDVLEEILKARENLKHKSTGAGDSSSSSFINETKENLKHLVKDGMEIVKSIYIVYYLTIVGISILLLILALIVAFGLWYFIFNMCKSKNKSNKSGTNLMSQRRNEMNDRGLNKMEIVKLNTTTTDI
jgi:hypothetical protein